MVRSSRLGRQDFVLVTGFDSLTDYKKKNSKKEKNNKMANHKSALKRIRSNEKRRVLNRYQHKTTVMQLRH
jgi:hypothetical protein